jgi:hypothetical protein
MEEKPKEALELDTITDSLGVVGSALSNDSEGETRVSSQEGLESFLKALVSSTNELVNQLEELSIMQKDMMLDEQRRVAEELSEMKAKDRGQVESGLIEPLDNLTKAIDDLTRLVEETDFSGSGIIDTIMKLLAGAGLTTTISSLGLGSLMTAAAGVAGAASTTLATVIGADQFMKSTYSEANAQSQRLETDFGMKAIKNAQGFTEAYEINGVRYKPDELPEQYQTILDAYGPGADPRLNSTKQALKRIESNKAMFEALKTGQAKASAISKTPDVTATTPAAVAVPVATSAISGDSVLTKTEEIENKESSIEIANPIVLDQSSGQLKSAINSKMVNYDVKGSDEVPDPNYYNGGELELELYP